MLSKGTINAKILILKGATPLEVKILDFDKKSIVYTVSGTPVCQYDQHSRARVGIKFSDYIVSDDAVYVFYSNVYNEVFAQPLLQEQVAKTLTALENLRKGAEFKTPFNLMSRACSYKVTQDFSSLRGQMARRLKFCEEEFIVALHWVLRDKMIQAGINIAEQFFPGCDSAGECDYASADYLSNMFGCLFAGCGRWKSHAEYASFNQSCTTPELVELQTGIIIPRSKYELEKQ